MTEVWVPDHDGCAPTVDVLHAVAARRKAVRWPKSGVQQMSSYQLKNKFHRLDACVAQHLAFVTAVTKSRSSEHASARVGGLRYSNGHT